MSRRHWWDFNPLAITVAVIIVLYILYWVLFIAFCITLIFAIFYWASLFHNEYSNSSNRYHKKNNYVPIIIYWCATLLSLCILLAALVNTWKIDETFLSWWKEGSNYVTVGKTKRWEIRPQLDKEAIVENTVISSMPEGNVKKLADMPWMLVNNTVDSIHNWFIQKLKNIFTWE